MPVKPIKYEAPCKATDRGCKWIYQSYYDDFGTPEDQEAFCENCGRWRDFAKAEFPQERESTPTD